MRTTMNLDDELMAQAKAYAASKHRTFTSVMEEGLRRVLMEDSTSTKQELVELPVSSVGGGFAPGFDPELFNNNAALLDYLDAANGEQEMQGMPFGWRSQPTA